MGEWRETTIGEVCHIFDGPHATPVKTEDGPWFLSISSLENGRLNLAESAHISNKDFDRWTRRVTPTPGDVLFSYETRLGAAALMPSGLRACLGRRMGLLRPDPSRLNSHFLLYAYLGPTFQKVIEQRSIRGATVDRIPLVEMHKWPISIPPLHEQKAIAAVLGVLDDKIAVNERIVTAALELAGAQYNDIALRATETTTVGDLLELRYGKALPAVSRIPGKIPVYGSGGISGSHNEYLVSGPGVIVGRKGTVGTVHWSEGSFFPIDTTFYVMLRRKTLPMEAAFFMLRSLGLSSMNSDSAVPGLNRGAVHSLEVRIPDQPTLRSFGQMVRQMFSLRENVAAESRKLAELRDTLLPKLMSGELRVREAEEIVGGAL